MQADAMAAASGWAAQPAIAAGPVGKRDAAAFDAHLWPLDRLGDALMALAVHAGLLSQGVHGGAQSHGGPALVVPHDVRAARAVDDALPARWIDWAAGQMGLQAEPVQTPVPDAMQLLRQAAPALLLAPTSQGLRVLLLVGRRAGHALLLGPDLRRRRCPLPALRALLCAPAEAPLQGAVDALLASAGVPAARQPRARQALLAQRLAAQPLHGVWLLRRPATAGLWQQLAQLRVPRRVAGMLALFALLYALEIAGWGLIGQAALDGRLDTGWLAAWVLLLLTLVPLRLLSSAINAGIALDAGTALRQRMLAGSLRMPLDTLRRQGSGQLLARVIESQALEAAGLAGALGLAVALLELACAAWVLLQGAAPLLHGLLLGGWLLLVTGLAWRHQRQLRRWTAQRLAMTDSLVERMVGHRTRLAQEDPARRDAEEDHELHADLQSSRTLDARLLPLAAAAPGGWILLSLAALAPAMAAASGAGGAGALAISLGGVLFAHRALGGVSSGLFALGRAAVAWEQAAPLFKAGAQPEQPGPFVADLPAQPGAGMLAAAPAAGPRLPAAPLLDATALAYAYRSGAAPVLRHASVQLGAHDRVLLAGPSGSGKSTLAALLVGLRQPASGLLLMGGLDRATLGDQWHRWATEAPQFHDNHIFSGTLAFNLLMGSQWPASPAALADAQALCEALGLGPLLQRMPAGLQQRVGAAGWQLSHGEKSRVFLARALLQRAPLTVLDESFAALDPHTLHRCLRTALQRAQALVVIAHP
jgi:ATP-binding cassette subfamily B protein